MEKNNTEKNERQILLEKLNDYSFSRKFYIQKYREAEEIIASILMVTSGASVVNGTVEEWGHENLFQLLDMFMINHENFSRSTLAEELQRYIFTWTMQHSEMQSAWSKPLRARLYQINDNSPETEETETSDAPETESETESMAYELAEHTFSIYANKIYHVFASDTFSEDVKGAIFGVLIAASNEAGVVTDNVPDIAKASFPVMMRRLNTSYQRAFIHSIDQIFYACLKESELKELQQYEKRFESKKEPLEVEESSAERDIDLLAVQLSTVLNNPAIPAKLAEIISDELIDVDIDTTSPEHIKHNLLNSGRLQPKSKAKGS